MNGNPLDGPPMTGAAPSRVGLRAFIRWIWVTRASDATAIVVGAALLTLTEGIGLLLLVPALRLASPTSVGATEPSGQLARMLRWLGTTPTLEQALVAVLVAIAARATLTWWIARRRSALELAVVGDLRRRLFSAIVALPWGRFTGERPAALVHAIGSQVDDVHASVLAVLEAVSTLTVVAAAVLAALVISPALTLAAALLGALLVLVGIMLRAPGRADGERLLAAGLDFFTQVSELIGGLKMVRAHGAERAAVARVDGAVDRWASLATSAAKRRARAAWGVTMAGAAVLALFVWIAVRVLAMPGPELMVALLVFARLVPRAGELQGVHAELQHGLPSFESVHALVARCEALAEPLAAVTTSAAAAPAGPAHVTLRDVTVQYPAAEQAVVSSFDLDLAPGTITVLMGETGAGKTTIGDLALGLLVPSSGEVRVDGAPLDARGRAAWRAQVGYLAQEPMLLHGTIAENLRLARPAATDEELRAALSAAACDFVEALPGGLHAAVGDRGAQLSGGERQRIALARALLRQPRFLVLDEATSALDAATEARVLESVRALRGRATVLMISHRESAKVIADGVVEIPRGS